MIEAFEIGVSLALRDGVSDSISLAQRNLAAIEKAISSSGVAIQSLRDAGLKAASIPVLTSRDQPPSSPVSQVAKNTKLGAPAGGTIAYGDSEESQLEDREILNVHSVVPIAEPAVVADRGQPLMGAPTVVFQPPEPASRADDRIADDRAAVLFGRELSYKEENSPFLPSVIEISSPESSAPAVGMDPPLHQSPLSAAPPAISLNPTPIDKLNSSDGISRPQSIELALFSDINVDPRSLELADTQKMVSGVFYGRASRAETGINKRSIATAQVLPRYDTVSGNEKSFQSLAPENETTGLSYGPWQGYRTETPLVSDRRIADDQRKSLAPQARRNDPEASMGDVYLDGLLVGRWVSRFLQKQAERADAGPTGFDAKRGRLLPGVTVGG